MKLVGSGIEDWAMLALTYFQNLSKNELVKGLPKIKFVKDKVCDACQLGKQIKTSFKKISTSRPLELLHMDLFGPNRIASMSLCLRYC